MTANAHEVSFWDDENSGRVSLMACELYLSKAAIERELRTLLLKFHKAI